MKGTIPTSKDVVRYLNERLEALGRPERVTHIAVLPYPNPMWMANWEAPELDQIADRELIEREIRDARWKFPQVMEEF